MTDPEKLSSIRRRIAMLRQALEDPDLLTELVVDGVSEKLDRAQVREELKELEMQESQLSGTTSRIYGVSFR